MKKTIKTLALITVTVAAVKAFERVNKGNIRNLKMTVKIADLDEYKALLKSLEA